LVAETAARTRQPDDQKSVVRSGRPTKTIATVRPDVAFIPSSSARRGHWSRAAVAAATMADRRLRGPIDGKRTSSQNASPAAPQTYTAVIDVLLTCAAAAAD
jgi:hypothetical protein